DVPAIVGADPPVELAARAVRRDRTAIVDKSLVSGAEDPDAGRGALSHVIPTGASCDAVQLGLRLSQHERGDEILGPLALVQHRTNLLGDRHLDPLPAREL